MANRYMQQFSYSFVPMKSEIFAQVAIGASGAPTLSAVNSKGVASISRNSAGDYSVTLSDTWYQFLGLSVVAKNSTGIPAAPDVGVKSETVASTKIVRFVCSAAGVATDPANGDTLFIHFDLKNSSAQ